MSGLVIDVRHVTGHKRLALDRLLGGTDAVPQRADVRVVVGAAGFVEVGWANVVALRVSDREWLVVKNRYGAAGVRGPDGMSELLAEGRRR